MAQPDLSQPLADRIRDEITARGPISFARFMDRALYEPVLGYYSRGNGIGRDFLTSPEVHPVFGALLGRLVVGAWRALGEPAQFDIVEIGAGPGRLAHDLLRALEHDEPSCYRAIRYQFVERSRSLRARLLRLLRRQSVRPVRSIPATRGLVLSNELFDALPVHLVEQRDGQLWERRVGWDDRFVVVRQPADEALQHFFRDAGVSLLEGHLAEVNLTARSVLRSIAGALSEGWLVTVDYGSPTASRYHRESIGGDLRVYRDGSEYTDPFERVGDSDLTAPIDFGALQRWGSEVGLQDQDLVSQRTLLRHLGIDDYLRLVGERLADPGQHRQNERAVRSLLSPDGLGGFLVLVQAKGTSARLPGVGEPLPRRSRTEIDRLWLPLLE